MEMFSPGIMYMEHRYPPSVEGTNEVLRFRGGQGEEGVFWWFDEPNPDTKVFSDL